jgi:hypothetical protein
MRPARNTPHKDETGRCSFEQIVSDRFPRDNALGRLARIVHCADFPAEPSTEPEAAGLWAISQGFTDVGRDALDIVARAAFIYDFLYAHLRREEEDRR